jgi:hypothetical protein
MGVQPKAPVAAAIALKARQNLVMLNEVRHLQARSSIGTMFRVKGVELGYTNDCAESQAGHIRLDEVKHLRGLP